VYENILNGEGFSLEENRVAIEIVGGIRSQSPIGLTGDYHPFLKK
jgi:UDP-N-acetyl-2-amino-2-deoxyglucuronate dehydrogenase